MDEMINNLASQTGQTIDYIKMNIKLANFNGKKLKLPIKQSNLKKVKSNLDFSTLDTILSVIHTDTDNNDSSGLDITDIFIVLDNQTLKFNCFQIVLCEIYDNNYQEQYTMSIYKTVSYFKGKQIKNKQIDMHIKKLYSNLISLINITPVVFEKKNVFKKRLI